MTLALIDQVMEIFDMYEPHLPLTNRQIFYRMVGAYDFPKEEKAYIRLCEHLVRARRAGIVPFTHIRDDGTRGEHPDGYYGAKYFLEGVVAAAEEYERFPAIGQPKRVEVWCEAQGMVPQLARVATPLGASVYSTGGFSSVTVTHEIAWRVACRSVPTMFLHVGDLDPSGQSIYDSMAEDIATFVWQMKQNAELNGYEDDPGHEWSQVKETSGFAYRRVALTENQVQKYNLETAPPKPKDSRTAKWVGETCQAEAMDPAVLAQTLKDEVVRHIDQDQFEKNQAQGERERFLVMKKTRGLLD